MLQTSYISNKEEDIREHGYAVREREDSALLVVDRRVLCDFETDTK